MTTYVDKLSILPSLDGTELVEVTVITMRGDTFTHAKLYATTAIFAAASLIRTRFTLTANATSTSVNVPGMLATSFPKWTPFTPHAANALSFLSIGSISANTLVLNHAANANIDQTFLCEITI